MAIRALIFDVDGTLAETEEIHRAAFNRAFAEDGLAWHWSVDHYRDLLRVTGGKERIRRHADGLDATAPPLDDARIARLHLRKNALFGAAVLSGACALRPGVEAMFDAAEARGLTLAIATTTSRANVEALLLATLGAAGPKRFAAIVAGEDVAAKKPAPDAYLQVLDHLGLRAEECLAFEDSRNGLTAANAAGIATVVTPSLYTAHEDFAGAAMIRTDLTGFDLAAIDVDGRPR